MAADDAASPPSTFVRPDWSAPAWVGALSTTRHGGTSGGPWGREDGGPGGLNLGDRCGDDPAAVAENRRRIAAALPAAPTWLHQVHGRVVHRVDRAADADRSGTDIGEDPVADAAVTAVPGRVLAIQTADCLPVLFADRAMPAVGAAHAGWRGLAGGVLEATIDAMGALGSRPGSLCAWLGPAIGPTAFEVGDDVRDAFVASDAACARHFVARPIPGKWLADLPALARRRLERAGVMAVFGSGLCTYREADRFYSYRRDGVTGRMASFVWIDDTVGRSVAR